MIQITFPTGVDSLTAKGLTQYDTGQRIKISGTGITTETVQVHFEISGRTPTVDVAGTVSSGVISALIPDTVTAFGRTITAWVYVIDGDARETKYTVVLPIRVRAKPAGHISPAEPPYLTANELSDRIVTAETAVTELSNGLTARYTKTETDRLLGAKADKAQSEWVLLTAINGWVNESNGLRVRLTQFGQLEFRGEVRGGLENTVMAILPVSYRPNITRYSLVVSTLSFGVVYVETSGNILLRIKGSGIVRVSMDGVIIAIK